LIDKHLKSFAFLRPILDLPLTTYLERRRSRSRAKKANKKRNEMKKYNEIVNKEVEIMGRRMLAKCNVVIKKSEDGNNYEVVLGEPADKNYRGISTTNYYEEFADYIKKKISKRCKC
jgi:hypothetical protein